MPQLGSVNNSTEASISTNTLRFGKLSWADNYYPKSYPYREIRFFLMNDDEKGRVLGELNKRRERWKVDFQQYALESTN